MKKVWNAFTLFLFPATLLVIGCGGGTSKSDDGRGGITPPTIVSINITPGNQTITVGESVTLTVTAVGTNITWPTDITEYTSTGSTAIFTPTVSRVYDFIVTAAADTTKKATARITVNPVINNVMPSNYIPIDFSDGTNTTVNTWIWGLNESGMLTGRYTDTNGDEYGALFTYDEHAGNIISSEKIIYDGLYQGDLDATKIFKINNSGEMVGTAQITVSSPQGSSTYIYGFLRDSGPVYQYMEFENPDNNVVGGTSAHGISNSGLVVGNYPDSTGKMLGFLYDGTDTITLDIASELGSTGINHFDINDGRTIVGDYEDANGNWHGFIYANNVSTTIDYPNATRTGISGINDAGYVVGVFTANGKRSGFVYDGKGTFTPFDYPNALATYFTEINNRGQIAGYYVDINGNNHGLLVTDLVSIP